jgi:cytochrome b subunit of formate dehydrogenase
MPVSAGYSSEAGHASHRRSKYRAFRPVVFFSALVILLVLSSAHAEEMACSDCHEDLPDSELFAQSVHGFMDCVDCHTETEDIPHPDEMERVDCAMCHDDAAEEYLSSIHGQARVNGDKDAPGCGTCHGDVHRLVPSSDPQSPVYTLRLPETCGSCHSDPDMVQRYGIPVAKPIEAYHGSVHFRMCVEGKPGPSCNNCHGTHALYAANDPRSKVFHTNVPETCGECHVEITEVFQKSVHGAAAQHGAREAPVCTDCHGEHRIISPDLATSPVFASNIPKMTCGRCHGDLRLAEKYDIATDSVDSYEDSFHGLASRSGRATVANCSSCHGVHDILPSSDPASHIHKDHLAETCGTCHPRAGERFAIGTVHKLATEAEFAVVYWIRWIYLWLIWGTIGGMLIHNGLDFYRKVKKPLPRPPADAVPTRQRMALGFRMAHVCLMVSFFVLVYTGFALKYPESWWASPLLRFEGTFGFRGWLHRAAAIAMIGAFVWHIVHITIDRRARSCIMKMRPTWHDVTEFRERLLWMLGVREEPPKCPTLGYPEKLEYIALMWGSLVMVVTGFALWLDNWMLRVFPSWFGDVATVVHFYEAILATLAILVWHFYFVIFDPVIYPMDTAWINGREVPARTMEREEDPELQPPLTPEAPRATTTGSLDRNKRPATG